jgi:putative chitinase
MGFLQTLAQRLRKPTPQPAPIQTSHKEVAAPVAVVLTEQQFKALFPAAPEGAREHLNRAMARYKIDSKVRVAAFLAQIGHESAGLTVLSENLNYSAQALATTWPTRYKGSDGKPNALAINLARKPERIANHTYANRMGNGDPESGDGWRYRGRGYIQTTGKNNYSKLTALTGINFVAVPDLLTQPEYAALAAAFYWADNKLNDLADAGRFDLITRKINGGTHGAADRDRRWEQAKQVLNQ